MTVNADLYWGLDWISHTKTCGMSTLQSRLAMSRFKKFNAFSTTAKKICRLEHDCTVIHFNSCF